MLFKDLQQCRIFADIQWGRNGFYLGEDWKNFLYLGEDQKQFFQLEQCNFLDINAVLVFSCWVLVAPDSTDEEDIGEETTAPAITKK